MKLRDLIPNLDKPAVSGSLDTEITSLAYDSRKVGPGIAFVALRGTSADGHTFIPKAIALGASAIIAEQAPADDVSVPWVHVRHSRIALAQAAAALHGHPAKSLTIAGVTGTNGKTTTAFLMHHLFNTAQKRSGLLGTVFYDLGNGGRLPATHTTPESLEIQGLLATMRDNGCRACAMEVSSHALDQDRVFGLPFSAAVFTNLTQDHLDYHGTMEKYFEAKVRLFEITAESSPRSALIINGDDAWGRKLVERFQHTGRVTRFGFGVHNEFRAINVRYDLTGTTFELEAKGRSFLVRSALSPPRMAWA
jgi:UDP-N-acetylmuramoyl-L-alanyl-D-glutamate--2,6-diaminopimelate ligase